MTVHFAWVSRAAISLAIVVLAGCGGGDDGSPPPTYAVSVTVSALAGSGLVLLNNGGDALPVATNGMFTFATRITGGMAYSVTVETQPTNPSQTCVVANGDGHAGGSNAIKVTATCTTNTYTVGGSVYGIAGATIQLSNNGSDTISINADGKFVFPTPVASGLPFAVTINAQPTDLTQHCAVSNGIGKVGGTDLVNLAVRCTRVGHFVYITESLSGIPGGGLPPGGVLAYVIDPSTGAFQMVVGNPFATDKCPCTLSVTPDGRFAYVGSGGVLYPYLIDNITGALSPTGAGTTIGASSATVRIDPTSRFAYAADPLANTLSAYSIDQTNGTLIPVMGSPFPTGVKPATPGFDPSGRFLYIVNSGSSNISAYTINSATGTLNGVAGSPFAASGNPDSVNIDVSGGFLYATSGSYAPISSYAIDAATGALTPIAGGPLKSNPALPFDAVFFLDPNSNRAYAVGHCAYAIAVCQPNGSYPYPFTYDLWTFAIDDQSGGVSQSGAPPHLFATDEFSDLTSVQIDPSGKFICVRVGHGGGIFYDELGCYTIDATTGALSAAYGSGLVSDIYTGGNSVEVWESVTIAK